jgi:polyisoprenoid-binding protein YceI
MNRPFRGVRRGVGVAALVLMAVGAAVPFLPSSPGVGRAVAETPAAAPGAYAVDTVHSSVIYRIKHMDVAYHYGRFNEFSGSFLLDAENPSASVIDLTIQTASVDSGNEGRDKHLRNPDFFDVEQFPTATFVANSVRKTSDDTFETTGEFTLHGVTKPITVTIHHTGAGQGRGGVQIAGMESTFTIKRSDFNLGKPGGVGDEVRITVSLEGARK